METQRPKPAADFATLTSDLALIKANYATRDDVAVTKAELSNGLNEAEYRLQTEIKDTEGRLKVEIKDTEGKLKVEIKDTEGKLKVEIKDTEVDLKTEFAKLKYELKAEILESKSSIIIWVVSAIFLAQLIPAFLKKLGL